jgi:hypothetical protein
MQSDCPGSGLCAINSTWAADPHGWCMCNTKVGLYGLQCNEICSQGSAILGINISASLIALAILLVSGRFLYFLAVYRGSAQQKQTRSVTPVGMTIMLVFVGSLFFVISLTLSSIASVGFRDVAQRHPDSQGRNILRISPSLDLAWTITNALAYCVSIGSIAALPLTWVSLNLKMDIRCRRTNNRLAD